MHSDPVTDFPYEGGLNREESELSRAGQKTQLRITSR